MFFSPMKINSLLAMESEDCRATDNCVTINPLVHTPPFFLSPAWLCLHIPRHETAAVVNPIRHLLLRIQVSILHAGVQAEDRISILLYTLNIPTRLRCMCIIIYGAMFVTKSLHLN